MSIATTINKIQYVSTGTETEFPIPFAYAETADIYAKTLKDGVENDFTGFTISVSSSSTTAILSEALPSGVEILFYRKTAVTQDSNYIENEELSAEQLESDFDKGVLIDQELGEQIDRCVRVSEMTSVEQIDLTLPAPVAGRGIKWNADADGFVNSTYDLDTLGDQAAASAQIASTKAGEAASSAALSRTWAIGSDEEIPETGEHSSKVNAGLASASATAAASSAATAQEAAQQAQAVSDAFETLANEATLTFNQNAQSKTDAFNANATQKQETMNETLEAAETYASQAEAAKDNASLSATAAAGSATTAQNAAGTATTKADEAADFATTAATKASEAAESAGSATTSASTASTAANTAAAKASEATTAATAASGSASAAATSADLAESWAIGSSEERPEGSAKYWAEQAAGGQVQADWNQTDTTAKDFIKNKPTNLLQNTATASNALTILGSAATLAAMASSINIGYGSAASRETVSLGYNAKASNSYCTSIGHDSQATGYYATALGEGTRATGSAGIAIGYEATASAADAIQIGKGTNATAHSLSVGFKGSGVNYTLLNGDGTIPVGRLTKALPEQSGQSGKYLTTDGTNASWDDVPPSTTITYWETNGDHSSGGETV